MAWLLQLATDLDIIHMVLVLQECNIQELVSQRVFQPDFRARPRRPGSVPKRAVSEAVRAKAKVQWKCRELEKPGTWQMVI